MNRNFPKTFQAQHQNVQPGLEEKMNPKPIYINKEEAIKKLNDKVAIITGGDSGIGRAVAIAFAKEGAKIAIVYLNEHEDAEITKKEIENLGGECILLSGDIGNEDYCISAINSVKSKFNKINILVNNAAEQHVCKNITDITKEQLEKTFRTNVFGSFFMTKEVIKHLSEGDCIINTTSITAYQGNETLIDYSMTKGALTSFTRSLAVNLVGKGIRVNSVAPGPVWTPLIPASFDETMVSSFGQSNPMKRAAQPIEIAEAFVFLASDGANFITGETIHVNGGEFVNG
ncbi:SDR family oxidoreductase [Clostridium sp. Sa3CUN1]|uniref:SDR family oxidoreductase n=1 Tax=Clostridium gallinarum TaxID=2762246 RepID=A0ABR8Q7K4_9CLOT|nr:SDR family oxidoreductase [Clostridium gallinarum]MBD7916414.1 SDR family oxidoreductase [Clostridium gallinarum]